MTTVLLLHIHQQFKNRHARIVPRMIAFIRAQTTVDDPNHHHQLVEILPQQCKHDGDNHVPIRQHHADSTSMKVDDGNTIMNDPNTVTSSESDHFIQSNSEHWNDTGISFNTSVVTGPAVVVHNHHCRRQSNTIIMATSRVPPPSASTSCIILTCHHDTTPSLPNPSATSTAINFHNDRSWENATSDCNTCSMDWNDTMAAFIIRLSMIAVMCYLIAISQQR